MLRHIVMIKYKDEYRNDKTSHELENMLIGLESSIDELKRMEVGHNISIKPSAMDLVLTADFNDVEGLDAYRVHPEHVKVLDFLSIVMDRAQVVDYIK